MIFCVGMLGNPLRHFEVYLGQWSISGPGRAFRIIPMLDGDLFLIYLFWVTSLPHLRDKALDYIMRYVDN